MPELPTPDKRTSGRPGEAHGLGAGYGAGYGHGDLPHMRAGGGGRDINRSTRQLGTQKKLTSALPCSLRLVQAVPHSSIAS